MLAGVRFLRRNRDHDFRKHEVQNERPYYDLSRCQSRQAVLRGLRYPVENVLEWLASGMSTEEILADYADLEREDILAALAYAARLIHVKRLDRFAA